MKDFEQFKLSASDLQQTREFPTQDKRKKAVHEDHESSFQSNPHINQESKQFQVSLHTNMNNQNQNSYNDYNMTPVDKTPKKIFSIRNSESSNRL